MKTFLIQNKNQNNSDENYQNKKFIKNLTYSKNKTNYNTNNNNNSKSNFILDTKSIKQKSNKNSENKRYIEQNKLVQQNSKEKTSSSKWHNLAFKETVYEGTPKIEYKNKNLQKNNSRKELISDILNSTSNSNYNKYISSFSKEKENKTKNSVILKMHNYRKNKNSEYKQYNTIGNFKEIKSNDNNKNRTRFIRRNEKNDIKENNRVKPDIQLRINYKKLLNTNDAKENKEKYIKKISRIQSLWKGYYFRKFFNYYCYLNKFIEFFPLLMINHQNKKYDYLFQLFNNIINLSLQLNIIEIPGSKNSYKNDLENYKINLYKFYNFLKNYQDNLKQISDLKKNIKKYNLNNNAKKEIKTFIITNNNFRIINNLKNIQNLEYNKLKENLINNNKFTYRDYINHFNSNLNIIKNEQISIKNFKMAKAIKQIGIKYKIKNEYFSILNNEKNKKLDIENTICIADRLKIINSNNNIYKNELDKEKDLDIILKENKDLKQKKNIKHNNKVFKLKNDNFIIKEIKYLKFNKKLKESEGIDIINSGNIFELNKTNNENAHFQSNKNKLFNIERKELEFIKSTEEGDGKEKLNYNSVNEIEKGDGLEINPFEMKRTKNNINNMFICYENNTQVLNNKESIYLEKAKNNIMKIILPIKIKNILKEWSQNLIFNLLIKLSKNK